MLHNWNILIASKDFQSNIKNTRISLELSHCDVESLDSEAQGGSHSNSPGGWVGWARQQAAGALEERCKGV